MKKNTIILISILGLVAISILWSISSYNGLVSTQEEVNSQWANVQNQYQRRADLIPNLVATVKGYATHESSTLEGVIAARAKATQITVNPENLTPEKLQQYQAAQGQLSSALGKLLMITENYPDLKANQNFIELQAQLEGTENRIAIERNRFNEVSKEYNLSIRRFPKNIIAGMFGFEKKVYFEAEKSSQEAPKVQF
jgi:LemA protein